MNDLDSAWTDIDSRPAAQLLNMELSGGWKVTKKIDPAETNTYETFSILYVVKSKSQEKAFLKAMDFESSFTGDTVVDRLRKTIQNFDHEQDLLEKCAGLSRVVNLIGSGDTHTNPDNDYEVAYYLIFERADGSVATLMADQADFTVGDSLLLMHQTTVALQQLHNRQIAHLDIKPSNILIYNQKGAKLADLGRSIQKCSPSPFDDNLCVGDRRFAPLELMYSRHQPLWDTHRLGCDLYLLGNILYFLIVRQSITQSLGNKLRLLNPNLYPPNQFVSYEEVFPFVEDVFPDVIQHLRTHPASARVPEIADVVAQLCDPDPTHRGLPLNKHTRQYSLHKFVSKFNLLHKRNKFAHLAPQTTTQEPSL